MIPKTTIFDYYNRPITHLTQWDTNVVLYINDWKYDVAPYINFMNRQETQTYTVATKLEEINGNKRVVLCVPNILLQKYQTIFLYITLPRSLPQSSNEENLEPDHSTEFKVLYKETIEIDRRKQPDDYIYEDNVEFVQVEVLLEQLQAAIDEYNREKEALTEYLTDFTEKVERGDFDGEDGRGITSTSVDDSGDLIIDYSDSTSENAGRVKGADGRDGTDGQDGANGFSPIITTSQDGNSLIITIVDAEGTKVSTLSVPVYTAGVGISIVNGVISNTAQFSISIVDELPLIGDSKVIYFVPKQDAEQNDVFDEYMWINSDWEFIGTTQIDLSNYQRKLNAGQNIVINQNTNEIKAGMEVTVV